SFALIAMTVMLRSKHEALTPLEKECTNAWQSGTILFILWGASLHLYSGFSIYRTAFGSQWISIATLGLSMFWSLLTPIMLGLGCRWRDEWLRSLALLTGSCALAAVLLNALTPGLLGALPFFNWRVVAFAVALVGLQLSSVVLHRHREDINEWERDLPKIFRCFSLFLLLWVLTQEGYETARYFKQTLGSNWERWAQMAVSLVWSLYGSALLLTGIARREQALRLAALALLAGTVVKVFLLDLSFLNGPSRIFSLAGLGISLIFISWLYSRFGTEKTESEVKTGHLPSSGQSQPS
ncbi:DUF2339 domain-containing protein, partial [bacterium]